MKRTICVISALAMLSLAGLGANAMAADSAPAQANGIDTPKKADEAKKENCPDAKCKSVKTRSLDKPKKKTTKPKKECSDINGSQFCD